MTNPILMDIPESFETQRLLIRVPQSGDGPALNDAIQETFENLHLWLPWAKERPSVQSSEEESRKAYSAFIKREDITYHLIHKQSGLILGYGSLHPRHWNIPRFETGYWCRKRFERQGYMTEAVTAILSFGFNFFKAKRIQMHCDSKNERSIRLADRVGMIREGELRNFSIGADGTLRNIVCFAMTDEDWHNRQSSVT